MAQAQWGLLYLALGVASFVGLTFIFRRWARSLDAKMWRGKELLEIVEIQALSHNVKVFSLRRMQDQTVPPFLPGQFLTFQISDSPADVRSYSLCSSATDTRVLQVGVKKIEKGLGSTWFHERRVGDPIWVYPPSGHFTDQGLESAPKVYVAGGIGITPLMSMIRTNVAKGAPGEMSLFYGMRTAQDLVFHDELVRLSEQVPSFRYFPVLMEESSNWSGERGVVTWDFIRRNCPSAEAAYYFVCGPEVMMESVVASLLREGISEDRIRTEKFLSRSSVDFSQIQPRQARVKIHGVTYDYSGRQTLLEFAESQGIQIPFSCRTGVCGTCQCRVKGAVTPLTDAGLTAREKSEGFILACVSFPDSDIELEPSS